MKQKQIIALVSATALVATALAGCGKTSEENTQKWVLQIFILCIMATIMQMRLKYPLRLWKNILQERLQWMMSISHSTNC